MNFSALQQRLVQFLNERIRNGDFTERGLGRLCGISQPHIHNVLKGARKLAPAIADRVMLRLGIDVLDLVSSAELRNQLLARSEQSQEATSHFEPTVALHVPPIRLHSAPPKKPPQTAPITRTGDQRDKAG